ncbi:hypothetical protein JIN77_06495 [Verrucomicrobiaceae bacterium R5-34]|uniref:Uncharacterized protein n=1 Tax=Oceaniferula flava TaxID=2800421 RepID=A0AAE2V933_9BACT|nr:hypothetical protein [Oceaniferula flavus]MBK1830366.1 hypothetical protein [Verrucomicrobiaceae bacterium R5-34]MBK1854458.1 hypothetical protein [Oceaniferula flavus]MBM1135764.1 hypothetical protein [Oceaniferula flavus]
MKFQTLLIAGSLAMSAPVFSDQAPAIPTGSLDVSELMVRQGVAPTFSWNIEYPAQVTDVVDINEDDEIIPKTKLRVRVSMIGVGLTDQYGTQYPAKVYMKLGNKSWDNIFSGTSSQVKPDVDLIDTVVKAGTTFEFAAKLNWTGYDYYYNDSSNITVLKNGDTPPSVAAGYSDQTSVAEYLRPYIQDGKIALGPMDVIYVSELTHSQYQKNESGYDMQDVITLVRFEKVAE